MQSRDAKKELRAFLRARGLTLPLRSPRFAVQAMLAFYREIRAVDCLGGDRDMLLFQWGTFDWGGGAQFDFDLTRQFITSDEAEDEDIFQLSTRFTFAASAELEALGSGDRWCEDLAALREFEPFVLSTAAYLALADRKDGAFELRYGSV